MFDNTKEPLYVDFNGGDPDGAYWMGGKFPFQNLYLKKVDFAPSEGINVWVSDGEIEMKGFLSLREKDGNKYWVVIPQKGSTKNVSTESWYHEDNIISIIDNSNP